MESARTSILWNHCYQSGPYILCMYCRKRFCTLSESTSKMFHHIKTRHYLRLYDEEILMLQTAGVFRSTNERLTDEFPDTSSDPHSSSDPSTNRRLTDNLPNIGQLSLSDRQGSHSTSPWEFFDFCKSADSTEISTERTRHVVCKYKNCNKILPYHGGTTMMIRHMESKHRIVWLDTQEAANNLPDIVQLSLSGRQRSRSRSPIPTSQHQSPDPSSSSDPSTNRRLTVDFPDIGDLSLLDRSPMPTSQHQSSDPSLSTDPSLPTLSGGSTSQSEDASAHTIVNGHEETCKICNGHNCDKRIQSLWDKEYDDCDWDWDKFWQ